jgi:hypothetical protein
MRPDGKSQIVLHLNRAVDTSGSADDRSTRPLAILAQRLDTHPIRLGAHQMSCHEESQPPPRVTRIAHVNKLLGHSAGLPLNGSQESSVRRREHDNDCSSGQTIRELLDVAAIRQEFGGHDDAIA